MNVHLRRVRRLIVASVLCLGLLVGPGAESALAWVADFFEGDVSGQALYEDMAIHPQAVRFENAVYVAFQGADLDPYLVVFEDGEDAPRGPYKVGENPLTGTWNPDDTHGGPSLLIDRDRRIVNVFFGAHGTQMKQARARIDDIGRDGAWSVSNWSTRVIENPGLALAVTYPQVVQSGDGTAYVYFRSDSSAISSVSKGSWLQARSDDGGESWSVEATPAISAAIGPDRDDVSAIQWYAHFEPGADGRIHAVASVQAQFAGSSAFDRSGIFYMYRDGAGGVWRGPSGRSLDSSSGVPPVPSDPSSAYETSGTAGVELHELEVPATNSTVAPFAPITGPFHNQATCAEDPVSGGAGLLYLEAQDRFGFGPYEWRFARFDKWEEAWVTEPLAATDQFFDAGTLEFDSQGDVDAFLAAGVGDGTNYDPYSARGGDIEWWHARSGYGWTKEQTIARSDVGRGIVFNNPQIVLGHEEEPLGPRLLYAEWNNDAGNFVHGIYLRNGDGTTVGKEFFPNIKRLAGDSRYETAVSISQQGFPLGSDAVVVASGEAFPDALTASTLAQAYSAPLLLASSQGLPPAVEAELRRLRGTRKPAPQVLIIGGSEAVTSAVDAQVRSMGFPSRRIAGTNRYETAVKVATEVQNKRGGYPTHAYVVSGETFADALSAGPLAATQGAPLLFASSSGLPTVTRDYIRDQPGIKTTVIAGGPAAVSGLVDGQLPGAVRVAGGDRYETAAKLATIGLQGYAPAGLPPSLSMRRFVVATGEQYADALAGGAYAARVRGPVVLTQGATLTPSTAYFLDAYAYRVMHTYIAGGEKAMSPAVVQEVAATLQERQYEK